MPTPNPPKPAHLTPLVAKQLMRNKDGHGPGLNRVYPNPTQNLYYGYLDPDIR